MAKSIRLEGGAFGRLSHGPNPEDNVVNRTLDFLRVELPNWRDDPSRPTEESERRLNSSLCDFLNLRARRAAFAMVYFKHEEPQSGRYDVDFGVHQLPIEAGSHSGSVYSAFLVIEAKRLPAPGSGREREYVTGEGEKPSGGIQRFKLGLHGSEVETAVMVGYIQKASPKHWHRTINQWISNIAESGSRDACKWSPNDRLKKMSIDSKRQFAWATSIHSRSISTSSEIRLHHLWVDMTTSGK